MQAAQYRSQGYAPYFLGNLIPPGNIAQYDTWAQHRRAFRRRFLIPEKRVGAIAFVGTGKVCFHNQTSQSCLRRVLAVCASLHRRTGNGIYRNIRISMDRAISTEKTVMMIFLFL